MVQSSIACGRVPLGGLRFNEYLWFFHIIIYKVCTMSCNVMLQTYMYTVVKEPPYQVSESGYGSFMLPVEVFFRNKDEPKKVRFEYDLLLPNLNDPPINQIRSECLTFQNPSEEFRQKLLKAGGVSSGGPQLHPTREECKRSGRLPVPIASHRRKRRKWTAARARVKRRKVG